MLNNFDEELEGLEPRQKDQESDDNGLLGINEKHRSVNEEDFEPERSEDDLASPRRTHFGENPALKAITLQQLEASQVVFRLETLRPISLRLQRYFRNILVLYCLFIAIFGSNTVIEVTKKKSKDKSTVSDWNTLVLTWEFANRILAFTALSLFLVYYVSQIAGLGYSKTKGEQRVMLTALLLLFVFPPMNAIGIADYRMIWNAAVAGEWDVATETFEEFANRVGLGIGYTVTQRILNAILLCYLYYMVMYFCTIVKSRRDVIDSERRRIRNEEEREMRESSQESQQQLDDKVDQISKTIYSVQNSVSKWVWLHMIVYLVFRVTTELVFSFSSSAVPIVGFTSVWQICTLPTEQEKTCCQLQPERAISLVLISALELFGMLNSMRVSFSALAGLKRVPYALARTSVVGFSYFVRFSASFWAILIALSILFSALAVSSWSDIFNPASILNEPNFEERCLQTTGLQDELPGFSLFQLLLTHYLCWIAYIYLPPHSYSFKEAGSGCMKCRKAETDEKYMTYGDLRKLIPLYVVTEDAVMDILETSSARSGAISRALTHHSTMQRYKKGIKGNGKLGDSNRRNGLSTRALGNSSLMINIDFDKINSLRRQVQAPVFCIETEVLMYNFTHVTYECKRSKQGELSTSEGQYLIGDRRFKFVKHIWDEDTDTHGFIAQSADRIVVGFRGTYSFSNIKVDCRMTTAAHKVAEQVPLPKLEALKKFEAKTYPAVHAGALAAYLRVQDRVNEVLYQLFLNDVNQGCPPRPIFFTGHSLGALLADLAAFDIAAQAHSVLSEKLGEPLEDKIVVQVTTFGSPRIGNFSFCCRFDEIIDTAHRFVVAGDGFTKGPLSSWQSKLIKMGYSHVGLEILLDLNGNLLVGPTHIERKLLHDGHLNRFVHSHSRSSYSLALMLWCVRCHGNAWKPTWWHQVRQLVQPNQRVTRVDSTLRPELMETLNVPRRPGEWYKTPSGCIVRDAEIQERPSTSSLGVQTSAADNEQEEKQDREEDEDDTETIVESEEEGDIDILVV